MCGIFQRNKSQHSTQPRKYHENFRFLQNLHTITQCKTFGDIKLHRHNHPEHNDTMICVY